MPRLSLLIFLLLLTGSVRSQDAALSIGFDGDVVAGRWNPFEFSFRDFSRVTLTFTIDQGDLRSGSLPAVHTFELAGGPGLTVVEDDLFVPAWQSFSWTAATPQRVIASGSFHPRDLDPRPLAVILSTAAARHAHLVPPDTRLVAQPSARLPERLAAWDGVSMLVIDGSTAPPSTQSVAAAAVAGASVVVLEPLPASFDDILLLASGPVTRLGSGQIMLGLEPDLLQQPPDALALEQYLATRNELELVPPVKLVFLAPLVLIYCVATVLLFRAAGLPGAVAGSAVGLLVAVLAWPSLMPRPPLVTGTMQLKVSAGGLSRSHSTVQVLDRRGGQLDLTGSYRPLTATPYTFAAGSTSLAAPRWRPVQLFSRPVLAAAGEAPLEDGLADDILLFFPEGSKARVTGDLIEVFLPEASP